MRQGTDPAVKEDLRQRRTRKFLVDALLSLLEERPFHSLSVVDICQRAMVHRTTFYAHFDDKQALLRYAVSETIRQEFEAPAPEEAGGAKAYVLAVFRNVLRFTRAHKGLYQAGVSGCSGAELQLLEDAVAGELCRMLSDPGLLRVHPGFNPELTAHFYAGAILALIRWWLDSDASVPDSVMLLHLEHFLPLPDQPL